MPACFLASLDQSSYEIVTVNVIEENVLAPIASAHYMVEGSRILDSQLAWHQILMERPLFRVNSQSEPCYGLTPFPVIVSTAWEFTPSEAPPVGFDKASPTVRVPSMSLLSMMGMKFVLLISLAANCSVPENPE